MLKAILSIILDKDFLKQKRPVWQIFGALITAAIFFELNALRSDVMASNSTQSEILDRVNTIQDALYYKLDIDTRQKSYPTPRQMDNSSMTFTNPSMAVSKQH